MGRDKEQRDKEGEAWKRFRFELERRWHNLYSGFVEAKHIHSMRRLGKCGFLAQLFDPKSSGAFDDTVLATANGLAFRPRRRLRARCHFSLTLLPQPGYSDSFPGVAAFAGWTMRTCGRDLWVWKG
jgi:hypothetical protein